MKQQNFHFTGMTLEAGKKEKGGCSEGRKESNHVGKVCQEKAAVCLGVDAPPLTDTPVHKTTHTPSIHSHSGEGQLCVCLVLSCHS